MNRPKAEIKLKQIFGFDRLYDEQWETNVNIETNNSNKQKSKCIKIRYYSYTLPLDLK